MTKSFIKLMDAEYLAVPHELLQTDGSWKVMPLSHLASLCTAPDGDSLLCGLCGSMRYVHPKEVNGVLCVACLDCGRAVYKWRPLKTLCAAPSHNDVDGCLNSRCWKFYEKVRS
jgi:hypothetical protein